VQRHLLKTKRENPLQKVPPEEKRVKADAFTVFSRKYVSGLDPFSFGAAWM